MSGKNGDVARIGRRDRLIKEKIHDPYMTSAKPSGTVVCAECRVVFQAGRWQWNNDVPENATATLCPACQRIRDRVPAGILTLGGDFFQAHKEEIINLMHNKVDSEKSRHPMKRIMAIEFQDDGKAVVTFTDMHLPRGVGEAISRAYEGDLDIQYTEGAGLLRVYWERQA